MAYTFTSQEGTNADTPSVDIFLCIVYFLPFLLLIVCTEIKLKHNFTAVSAMLKGTSVVIGTGRQLFF